MNMEKQTKHQLYQHLLNAIMSSDIVPEQFMPSERQLVDQTGLSRSSVREVTSRLALGGLIETKQGGRSRCKNLLASHLDLPLDLGSDSLSLQLQVLEVRAVLEGEAAFYAAQRATPEQMKAISTEFSQMQQRKAGQSTLAKAKADLQFHMLIAESSHHLLVTAFSQLFYSRYFNAIYGVLDRALKRHGHYPDGISYQHESIYHALMQRQADKARTLARGHILYTRRLLEPHEDP